MYVAKYELYINYLVELSLFITTIISLFLVIKYIKKCYEQKEVIDNNTNEINSKNIEIAKLQSSKVETSTPVIVVKYGNDGERRNLYDILNQAGCNTSKEQQKIIDKSLMMSHHKEMGFSRE